MVGSLLLLQGARQEVVSLPRHLRPAQRFSNPVTPDSTLGPRQLVPLSGPLGYAPSSGRQRLAPREVREKELGRTGTGGRSRARAGGGARGRRSGGDTCGGAGGAGLGARGFKKVWRGAGAFPGLAEGRRAEAEAAAVAALSGSGDALSAPTDPAPLKRGPKKLWAPASPAELPCGASLPSLPCSPPAASSPSPRAASPSRRLQN